MNDLRSYLDQISAVININEIKDPISFNNFNKNCLNIFSIDNISNEKYKNLLNQIKVANKISNLTGIDLVTMPINKSLFKKTIIYWYD